MGGLTAKDVDLFAVSRRPRAHLWRKALFVLNNRPKRTLADRARNMASIGRLSDTIAAAVGLDESRRSSAHAVRRASPGAPRERGVRQSVRRRRGVRDRRLRRLRQHVVGTRSTGSRLTFDERVFFPHSLGLLYLAMTQYLGFPNYGDEFKVMGLAPYGEPRLRPRDRSLVHLEPTAAVRAGPLVLQPLVGRRRDDVGAMASRRSAASSPRSSRRCLARRADASEPVAASTKRSPPRCRRCSRRPRMHVLTRSTRRRSIRASAWLAAAR